MPFSKDIKRRALLRREQCHHLNSAFLPDGDRDVISFCIYFYLPSLDRFFFLSENLGNRNVPIFLHFSTQKSELFRLNRNTWQVWIITAYNRRIRIKGLLNEGWNVL